DNTSCNLAVQYSLFSSPRSSGSRDRPDLIRQTSAFVREVRYEGKRNAYHDLAAFWVRPTGKDELETADWAAFKKRISAAGGDANSSLLTVSPWKVPNPQTLDRPEVAFDINSQLPELRRLEK